MIAIIIRVGLGVLAVVALFLLYRLARGSRARGEPMTVLARHQLTRGSTVALVKVIDKALVLGVTEQRISLLAEADLPSVVPRGPTEQLLVRADSEPDALEAADTIEPDSPVGDSALGDPDDLVFNEYQGCDTPEEPERELPSAPQILSEPQAPGEPRLASESRLASERPSAVSKIRRALAGSALSLATWRDAVAGLRERTVRRPANPGSAIRYHVRTVRRS